MRNKGFNLLTLLAIIPLICIIAFTVFFTLISFEILQATPDLELIIHNVIPVMYKVLRFILVAQIIISVGMLIFNRSGLSSNSAFLALTAVDVFAYIAHICYFVYLLGFMFYDWG